MSREDLRIPTHQVWIRDTQTNKQWIYSPEQCELGAEWMKEELEKRYSEKFVVFITEIEYEEYDEYDEF